jgi:hypothetical protein
MFNGCVQALIYGRLAMRAMEKNSLLKSVEIRKGGSSTAKSTGLLYFLFHRVIFYVSAQAYGAKR